MPSTRGKARIFEIMAFLRALAPGGPTDLGEAMKKFVAEHERRGLVVVLSDLYDPHGFERGINVLRYAKFETLVLEIADAREASPDVVGDVRLVDCETGEARELTVTPKLRERLRAAHEAHHLAVQRFCAERQVSHFRADVSVPFDEIVLRVLRRGGAVA